MRSQELLEHHQRADAGELGLHLLEPRYRRLVLPGQCELARGIDVGVAIHALPRPTRGLGWVGGDHTRAHVDREVFVGCGNPELEYLRAEVVEVAADARLGLDARVELVAALRGCRCRTHA